MSISQIEHADAYSDPLPCKDTLDRMEQLFTDRRREMIVIKNKQMQLLFRFDGPDSQISDRCREIENQLAQAQMRLKETHAQIVEVAGQICDEHAAAEIVTT